VIVKWFRPIAGALVVGAAAVGYQLVQPEPVYSHVPITTKIVFNREIAQIFQRKCFQCHTDGNVAMALTTYKEARPWAVAIKEEILERKMPPWSAASGYGHFTNDMSLTAREISLILSWADGGAPSGVLLVDEDKQPVFVPSLTSWEQGEPDEVVKVAGQVMVAAGSPFRVERFDVNPAFKRARSLRALQFNPADRKVIRYAAVYETKTGRWLGTWTPSTQVNAQPDDFGVELNANTRLTVEIGYRGNPDGDGSGAGDLGFYFREKPAQRPSHVVVTPPVASVAANKTNERVRGEITIKSAANVTALWPKLGSGAKSLEVTAFRPDGTVEPMLWLNNYRAEWPTSYILNEAVALPAGTRLVMTAYYDNAEAKALQAAPSLHVVTVPTRLREATARQASRPPATLGR
jgi:hypothetical protein